MYNFQFVNIPFKINSIVIMNDVSGHDENSINTDLTYESGDENVSVCLLLSFVLFVAMFFVVCLFFRMMLQV